MSAEYKDFLNSLIAITDKTTYDVFLPHAQKLITIKQLDTEQFNKLLVTYAVNAKRSYIDFNKTFFSIIHENLLVKDFDLKNISLFDAKILILKTRQASISDTFTVFYTQEDIDNFQLLNTKTDISLLSHIEKIDKNILPKPPLSITSGEFNVLCSIPTLFTDILFEEYFIENVDEEKTDIFIENFFLKEIAKFIHEINIQDKHVNFNVLTIDERIQIVKKLPSRVVSEIIKCVEKIRQPLIELATVTVTEIVNNEEVIFDKELPLDSALFNF